MTLLEILIPSVPERADKVERLKATLLTQIGNLNVTISIYITDSVKKGGQTIGFKRQHLLQNSTSKYVAFIDDDDIVSDDYISQIYNALKTNPDVVTFNGFITTNGLKKEKWEIKVGNDYNTKNNVYYRPPNHLSPIKTKIALAIGYPVHLSNAEDYDYCMRLKKSGLIQTSVHIAKELYHYDYSNINKLYK